jgi:hypothetical protein
MSEAITVAIPSAKWENSTYPDWLFKSLIYYIKKKRQFLRNLRNLNLYEISGSHGCKYEDYSLLGYYAV